MAEALEDEVAWHSPARFQETAQLAHRMLTGPDAKANEQLLYTQDQAWDDLYQDALHTSEPALLLREGGVYDWSGRGGTAVWRAYRRVDLQDFEEWLADGEEGAPAERVMKPPGWLVRAPAGWRAHAPAQTVAGQLPQPFATWAAEGKVLAFPYRSRQALWPLLRRLDRPPGWEPVPGIEPLTAAAAGLRPEQVTGFIEAALIEWNHEFEEEPTLHIALDLPADKAHRFGFITAEEQRAAMAKARTTTLERMDAIVDALEDDELDEHKLRQLREAQGNAREFRRLAKRHGKRIGPRFTVARASWRWPGQSVAGEIVAGAPADLVEWLASEAYKRSSLLLEESMQEAWERAFDLYRRSV